MTVVYKQKYIFREGTIMKKVFAVLLAALLTLTLAIPAFADAAETGSITLNNINESTTYDIYRLLDLESYDVSLDAYAYTVNSDWTGFFATSEALEYVSIDGSGYVTWEKEEDAATVAAFAKLALDYAKKNDVDPVKSSANVGEMAVSTGTDGKLCGKFSDLALGWYLVDSTIGSLCGLTTTKPNASLNEKNGIPTLEKDVQEGSTSEWGDKNYEDMEKLVYFRVTIHAQAGAENYVLHDLMSDGFTFDKVTKVEHKAAAAVTSTTLTEGTDYTIWKSADVATDTNVTTDDCTLELRFTKALCDRLGNDDLVTVYYQAFLNDDAVIAGEGNPNEAWLEYGEGNSTTHDITKTYTFAFDVVKTDSHNALIDGAEFKIYDAATGGNEIKVVRMEDGTYRRAGEGEEGVSIVVKDGKARVIGFNNGTYYLEETVAPNGYNKLTVRQKFVISNANLDATFNEGAYVGSGVQVINKTGSMLPETGGFGTTLFIAIGGVAMLAAGVLLFAKKRMSQIAE